MSSQQYTGFKQIVDGVQPIEKAVFLFWKQSKIRLEWDQINNIIQSQNQFLNQTQDSQLQKQKQDDSQFLKKKYQPNQVHLEQQLVQGES